MIFKEISRNFDMLVFKGQNQTSRIVLVHTIYINHVIPAIKNGFIVLFRQFLRNLLAHKRPLALLFAI